MPVVRQMLEQSMGSSVFTYAAVVWTRMFRVFGAEYTRLLATGNSEMAQPIIPELKALLQAIREQAHYIPLLHMMIADLKAEFPSLRSESDIF